MAFSAAASSCKTQKTTTTIAITLMPKAIILLMHRTVCVNEVCTFRARTSKHAHRTQHSTHAQARRIEMESNINTLSRAAYATSSRG